MTHHYDVDEQQILKSYGHKDATTRFISKNCICDDALRRIRCVKFRQLFACKRYVWVGVIQAKQFSHKSHDAWSNFWISFLYMLYTTSAWYHLYILFFISWEDYDWLFEWMVEVQETSTWEVGFEPTTLNPTLGRILRTSTIHSKNQSGIY